MWEAILIERLVRSRFLLHKGAIISLSDNATLIIDFRYLTKLTLAFSKSAIETIENSVKYVQSSQ